MTRPIPDYGEIFLLNEFVEAVQHGIFCDDDGSGYYAIETEYYDDKPANPSDVFYYPQTVYTHVMWFNK